MKNRRVVMIAHDHINPVADAWIETRWVADDHAKLSVALKQVPEDPSADPASGCGDEDHSRSLLINGYGRPVVQTGMDLTDKQWIVLAPLLEPTHRADGRGRPWRDARAVLNGVLWILRTGAPWKDLPTRYPPYQTCHRRFQAWQRSGVLERVLQRLSEDLRDRGKLDLTEGFIDATFTAAKKGAPPSDRPSGERAAKSWRSATAMVFLSPSTWPALHRPKSGSSKTRSRRASSKTSRRDWLATRPTTAIASTTR